jgi:hypothetical protein
LSLRLPVQILAFLAAAASLLVGILGLVSAFDVSTRLDVLRLLIGVAGVGLARTSDGARAYLTGGGAAYLLLWTLGLVSGGEWVRAGYADNWLHFLLGGGMIGLGALATSGGRSAAPA